MWRGGRDSNAKAEGSPEAEDLADSVVALPEALARTDANSGPFAAGSRPFVTGVAKPSEEDIEDAIVRAMLEGQPEVAEMLARALKARREAGSRYPRTESRHETRFRRISRPRRRVRRPVG
jgi:hypothetical protein